MRARRIVAWRCLGRVSVSVFVLTVAGSLGVGAQGRELPNDEPSSTDTLFDRSDLGNVVQQARMEYSAGTRGLKRAENLTAKLVGLSGKKRDNAEKKIASAYAGAVDSFKSAIGLNSKMVEAYVGLAAAFRGSGKYRESLQVCSQGMRLAPDDDALFEGWAQSLMSLDMLGDATQAHATLVETNPARAELLIGVMEGWLVAHREDPGELDSADVERMAEWIANQAG